MWALNKELRDAKLLSAGCMPNLDAALEGANNGIPR